jgi:4-amino-4-deoxy-L-arabinose transferase-like glycosyltransferase
MNSTMSANPSAHAASRPANPDGGLGSGAGFPTRLWRVVCRSGLLIPLVFIILAVLFAPIRYSGEFDVDEGVNLMKGLLLSRGHALYSEIWSDQAPLATVILSQWLQWFGASVVASRILVLLFSALLLWAFYQAIRLSLSEAAALAAAVLLLLSAWYMRLSISVMIGLPALSLGFLSVYLLLLAQERRGPWLLIASGAFLAASLQTKLFTGILVPVVLVYLLFLAEGPGGGRPPLRQRIGRCAAWLGALLVLFGIVGLIFGSLDPRQLVAPHLGAATRTAFVQGDNLAYLGTALLRQIATLPLAIVGLVWAFKNRKTAAFLPAGWLLMGLAFLLYERPLWYHHVLVLTIPLVWLSAFGVEAGVRAFGRRESAASEQSRRPGGADRAALRSSARWALLLVGVLLAVLAVFDPLTRKPRLREEIPGPVPEYGEGVADLLCPGAESRAAGETWVFTDRPIYAFQAGLSVPPPMAVLSAKRLFSGTITENDLLDVMNAYHPKYVLLERYLPQYGKDFLAAVATEYDLAREYSLGLEGWPGQLLLPHQPATGNGGALGRSRSSAQFGGWLSLDWNPAFAGLASGAWSGDCLQVRDLRWARPEDYAAPDVALSIRLVDAAGEIWAQHDEQLGSDKNTPRDRAQLPYFVNLLVPAGTPPGTYEAQLVVYDPASGQPLPVTPAEGAEHGNAAADGGNRLVLGPVQIARPPQEPALRRAQADFGAVRLAEAKTPATQVSPGDGVPLSLLWQAGPGFRGESLVVVAQLLDKDGNVVAGLEEEPLQGRYPSTDWQPQELVRDRHLLTVPQGTPPGQYELIVGLYTLPDRTRLKTGGGFLGLAKRDYFPVRPIRVGPPPS